MYGYLNPEMIYETIHTLNLESHHPLFELKTGFLDGKNEYNSVIQASFESESMKNFISFFRFCIYEGDKEELIYFKMSAPNDAFNGTNVEPQSQAQEKRLWENIL